MVEQAQSEEQLRLARDKARVGTTLRGKWHLDALLGVGGMGAVYAATHRNGTRAAVKILHTELSANPVIRQRFQREGQIANTVGHDGAVRVLDDDVAEDGSVYLVAEFLEGETLEEHRVRSGGILSETEVLPIADAILDVLVAAHQKGVVHRDLKPENVFLTKNGVVKILDFGIARSRSLNDGQSTNTAAGSALGTPSFMAPEQARGRWEEVDHQTDLWACGATMFTLLSGKLLNEGATHNEALLSAMTNAAPPLASVAPSVSTPVALLVDRAIEFDKSERFRDAKEMQQAVRDAYRANHARPIDTAPRPKVPEVAAHAMADLPSLSDYDALLDTAAADTLSKTIVATKTPTTAGERAVAMANAPPQRRSSRGLWAALGALVLGCCGAVAIFVATRHRHPVVQPVTQTASAPVATSASAPPVTSPTTSSAPVESAPTIKHAPSPSTATATATVTHAKPSCTPPYVIDPATGKKTWKVECL